MVIMSKKQILIDQIINIANGLTTDAINELNEQLTSLEEKKTKEVFSIISKKELEDIRYLYNELVTEDEIPINVTIECFAHVGTRLNHDNSFKNEPYVKISSESESHYDSVHLDSHLDKFELLNNSAIKEIHYARKKKIVHFNKILKAMEEKYKINSDVILNFIEED